MRCRDISKLISRSMDAELTWAQRWSLRLHILYCAACRRYRKQVIILRQLTRQLSSRIDQSPTMPPELREQIADRIQRS